MIKIKVDDLMIGKIKQLIKLSECLQYLKFELTFLVMLNRKSLKTNININFRILQIENKLI